MRFQSIRDSSNSFPYDALMFAFAPLNESCKFSFQSTRSLFVPTLICYKLEFVCSFVRTHGECIDSSNFFFVFFCFFILFLVTSVNRTFINRFLVMQCDRMKRSVITIDSSSREYFRLRGQRRFQLRLPFIRFRQRLNLANTTCELRCQLSSAIRLERNKRRRGSKRCNHILQPPCRKVA